MEGRDPVMLPVDEVQTESLEVSDRELGESIHTKKKLDEFAAFQDNQVTRSIYLAETAELA